MYATRASGDQFWIRTQRNYSCGFCVIIIFNRCFEHITDYGVLRIQIDYPNGPNRDAIESIAGLTMILKPLKAIQQLLYYFNKCFYSP